VAFVEAVARELRRLLENLFGDMGGDSQFLAAFD
jgi:hypothetical protein